MDTAIKKRIFKNAILSIFIYATPVVALFVYLKASDLKPWKDKSVKAYTGQIDKYKEKK